jgi:C-terminal processing protease CtpA/Prc
VGFGYRLVIPVGAYYTWHDNNLEGRGVEPDFEEAMSPEALWKGEDNQLKRAFELVTGKAAVAIQ